MCRQPLLQQEQQMVVRQDAYLTSRATAMQNVESTIHELGGIFQQLAHMVSTLSSCTPYRQLKVFSKSLISPCLTASCLTLRRVCGVGSLYSHHCRTAN